MGGRPPLRRFHRLQRHAARRPPARELAALEDPPLAARAAAMRRDARALFDRLRTWLRSALAAAGSVASEPGFDAFLAALACAMQRAVALSEPVAAGTTATAPAAAALGIVPIASLLPQARASTASAALITAAVELRPAPGGCSPTWQLVAIQVRSSPPSAPRRCFTPERHLLRDARRRRRTCLAVRR